VRVQPGSALQSWLGSTLHPKPDGRADHNAQHFRIYFNSAKFFALNSMGATSKQPLFQPAEKLMLGLPHQRSVAILSLYSKHIKIGLEFI